MNDSTTPGITEGHGICTGSIDASAPGVRPLEMVVAGIVTPRFRPLMEIFRGSFQDEVALEIVEQPELGHGEGDFQTESWYNAIEFKAWTTLEKIRKHQGKILIFADMDIQFFRPIRPTIEEIFRDASTDLALQAEGYPVSHCGFNCGFLAIRCNRMAQELYEGMCCADLRSGLGDQSWLNGNLKRFSLGVVAFPPEIWAWSQSEGRPPKNIILHHANCTGGANALEQKLRQIKVVRDIVENMRIEGPHIGTA